jgi:acetate kinase
VAGLTGEAGGGSDAGVARGGPSPILVVNAGSSSLKLRVLAADDRVVGSADLPAPRGSAADAAIAEAVRSFGPIDAVAHRVVHGGTLYRGAGRLV